MSFNFAKIVLTFLLNLICDFFHQDFFFLGWYFVCIFYVFHLIYLNIFCIYNNQSWFWCKLNFFFSFVLLLKQTYFMVVRRKWKIKGIRNMNCSSKKEMKNHRADWYSPLNFQSLIKKIKPSCHCVQWRKREVCAKRE